MNLVIDIGNTRVKVARFEANQLLSIQLFETFESFKIAIHTFQEPVQKMIVSSVLAVELNFLAELKCIRKPVYFNSNTPLPINNDYQSKGTLGSDRLAAAAGASLFYPEIPVLNIDTGTCIKYNFVTASNSYLGGAISPGLAMRLKALNHYTAALPLVPFDADFNQLIGTTTESSILSGCLLAAIAEADGFINEYKMQYPSLTVVVSGGDTEFFVKRLKNSTFARPHLVLEGLNYILEFNASN